MKYKTNEYMKKEELSAVQRLLNLRKEQVSKLSKIILDMYCLYPELLKDKSVEATQYMSDTEKQISELNKIIKI